MPVAGMTEAVGADDDPPPDEVPAAGGRTGGDRTPPLAVEIARVTGLLLVVLLPVHVVTVVLADPRDVAELLDRWEDRRWLAADWGFLTVGVVHSILALRPRLLGLGGAPTASSPRPDGDALDGRDPFGQICFALVAVVTVGLYLAASWAMLRLV